jgi:hypothetical protein
VREEPVKKTTNLRIEVLRIQEKNFFSSRVPKKEMDNFQEPEIQNKAQLDAFSNEGVPNSLFCGQS